MMSGINECIERIMVERNKKVDGLILGEVTKIATENGLDTIISLNEKAIVSALKKQIPQKPLDASINDNLLLCPYCRELIDRIENHCSNCGQRLKWRDAE